ncbi:MAG: hypothetical protein ACOY30_01135 [Bacillota bacterium]
MPEQFIPHPALLPVLLALSGPGENVDKTLDDIIRLIQSTKEAMQAMRSSVETFQAGIMKMAPQPVDPKYAASPLPVKEAPAQTDAQYEMPEKEPKAPAEENK